ncbi:MAG: hypothetical protein WB868_19800 [Xanthobacteraceae bacterium]
MVMAAAKTVVVMRKLRSGVGVQPGVCLRMAVEAANVGDAVCRVEVRTSCPEMRVDGADMRREVRVHGTDVRREVRVDGTDVRRKMRANGADMRREMGCRGTRSKMTHRRARRGMRRNMRRRVPSPAGVRTGLGGERSPRHAAQQ